MLSNFKGSGDQLTVTLGNGETGYAVGDPYLIGGNLLGVIASLTRDGQTVMNNVASAEGDEAIVVVEGVFSVPKATGAVVQGDRLYWDVSEDEVTTTGAGNIFAGFAHADAAENDATVDILLVNGDSAGSSLAANVPVLAGTLTGTVDGTIADVAAIALSTSDTYTDAAVNSAVNTAITSTNLQLKELQTKLNAVINALVTAGIMDAP